MAKRTLTRRHRVPKRKKFGFWLGYGRQVMDANSGGMIPERLSVPNPEGAGRVYYEFKEGTRDRPKEW